MSQLRTVFFLDHFSHGSVSDLVHHSAPDTRRMKQLKCPTVSGSVGTNGKDYVRWHCSSDCCLLIYSLSQNTEKHFTWNKKLKSAAVNQEKNNEQRKKGEQK